ncbi:ABC-F family ATP-binding cassette domain-containing protein [soil metagenome]
MLFLQDIGVAFGGQTVLDSVTWAVRQGDRVGLIGPNGAGKSTLLKVISGQLKPDHGDVRREGALSVGYLAQDVQELVLSRSPLEEALHAFDDVLALEKELADLTHVMETEDPHTEKYAKQIDRLSHVQTELHARESHLIRPRTEAVLSGLGFADDAMHRPLSTFSGGWRMRVALARMLLRQPDVLLLDEPTNHLDIESIDWLEGYLRGYPGAVVLVSHDRYFLERMVTGIAELHSGRIESFAGSYSFYLEERVARRQLQQSAYDNQQRSIAETERFIDRFRAKASKARQVQSRVKLLDKLERIAPPPTDEATVRFRFPEPPRSGRQVVSLSSFSKSYVTPEEGEIIVFENATPLLIERGDKIALVGQNGAGKSTLARMLLGTEPFEGKRDLGHQVEAAHFAQHQADLLDPTMTVLGALRERGRGQSETQLRSLLGAFLFTGDDVFKEVAVLSGGERSRLALARALLQPANFLVLDEPTNHLDLASKQVLAEALRQYGGAFVVVSHDRHFLDQIVNKVWFAERRGVAAYDGNYSDAHWQRTHGTAAKIVSQSHGEPARQAQTAPSAEAPRRKTKEDKRRDAEMRQSVTRVIRSGDPLDPETLGPDGVVYAVRSMENEIEKREAEKAKLEADLANPEVYADEGQFKKTMARFREIEKGLERLYQQWEELAQAAPTEA